ncbi:predicted protein [Nematostella vectensis]|uniref:Metalloendopeptidase n=1 Tax=Nematostella vectensis TaxID=45351 RepID=A7SEU6_NEMVE|nr:predicted protein [Nematostella vectensis]|eukprot:XP_001629834.1 predicted protein [Nematostella vectensis]
MKTAFVFLCLAAIAFAADSNPDEGTSAEGVIASAMREWESKTCIRFKRRQNEMNYVYFYKGKGCSSYVGMYGGGQPISLADGCWYHGTVAHEIEAKFNFEKYTSSKINTMNTPYDYDSLMHYGSHYFSYNGKPTIVAKKGGATFGQRSFISDLDAHLMSMRYDCPAYKGEYYTTARHTKSKASAAPTKHLWPPVAVGSTVVRGDLVTGVGLTKAVAPSLTVGLVTT